MFKVNKSAFLYFFIAFAFIFTVGEKFYEKNNSPSFQKASEKLEYQLGYQNVYAVGQDMEKPTQTTDENEKSDKKIVYLTFDDGPSPRTLEILDILKEYDIKATFFVLSDDKELNREILKRIYDEGHSIGVHSNSHSYEKIYKSVDNFLEDFNICLDFINDVTGEKPNIFRFPGGSVNSYNKKIRKDLAEEMTRRGFTYFDWNVCSDDAVKGYTEDSIYNKVISGCKDRSNSVVLMHDSAPKKATVSALKRIIPDLIAQGFTFEKINSTTPPVQFKIQ